MQNMTRQRINGGDPSAAEFAREVTLDVLAGASVVRVDLGAKFGYFGTEGEGDGLQGVVLGGEFGGGYA